MSDDNGMWARMRKAQESIANTHMDAMQNTIKELNSEVRRLQEVVNDLAIASAPFRNRYHVNNEVLDAVHKKFAAEIEAARKAVG